jgi:hypothetical protein
MEDEYFWVGIRSAVLPQWASRLVGWWGAGFVEPDQLSLVKASEDYWKP